MGRDTDPPYRELIEHPVQQFDAFLLQFDLDDEWAGIVGGFVAEKTPRMHYVSYAVQAFWITYEDFSLKKE